MIDSRLADALQADRTGRPYPTMGKTVVLYGDVAVPTYIHVSFPALVGNSPPCIMCPAVFVSAVIVLLAEAVSMSVPAQDS